MSELSILYLGFKLFIISEFLIFLSLFTSFFNYILLSLSLSSSLFGSLFLVFFAIPYSNLLILLYSSFSIQSSLIFIKLSFLFNIIEGISSTVAIGLLFLVLQIKEFVLAIFCYSSSFMGSLLYFTSGLHGLHVVIGLILLLFSFYIYLSYYINYRYYHSSFYLSTLCLNLVYHYSLCFLLPYLSNSLSFDYMRSIIVIIAIHPSCPILTILCCPVLLRLLLLVCLV